MEKDQTKEEKKNRFKEEDRGRVKRIRSLGT